MSLASTRTQTAALTECQYLVHGTPTGAILTECQYLVHGTPTGAQLTECQYQEYGTPTEALAGRMLSLEGFIMYETKKDEQRSQSVKLFTHYI